MARIKITSGDIYQITLPNKLGFAYAKCINLLEIYPDASYPILIRVYNYRSISPQPVQKFIEKELVLSPLLIAGMLSSIKSGSWILLDQKPLQEGDIVIPNYKYGEPYEEPKEWFYIIEADISKKVKVKYDDVKHLEKIGAIGSDLVRTKIAMALLQAEGKIIRSYFKLIKYYELEFYKQTITIPPYYKQPTFMQGKAITQE